MCLPLQSWLLEVYVPSVVQGSSTYRRGRLLLGSVCSVWPPDSWQGAYLASVVMALGSVPAVVLGSQTTVVLEHVTRRRGRLVVEKSWRTFGGVLAVAVHGSWKCARCRL